MAASGSRKRDSRRPPPLLRLWLGGMEPDIEDEPFVAVEHVVIGEVTLVHGPRGSAHAPPEVVIDEQALQMIGQLPRIAEIDSEGIAPPDNLFVGAAALRADDR